MNLQIPVHSEAPVGDGIPRLVLDTNVCLDLFVFADPVCAALRNALQLGRIELVTRADCRAEWQRVLRYPVLALDEVACARYESLFDNAIRCVDVDRDESIVLPRCRDTDDQKFLELARDAAAIALVTRDAELLKLAPRLRRLTSFAIVPPSKLQADGLDSLLSLVATC